MQTFGAASVGTTQESEVAVHTAHAWHPEHLLQELRREVELMALMKEGLSCPWETGRGTAQSRALR